MIAIIDYGMGNLGSIANMIKRIGFESIVTSDISKIRSAQKLILPGVGNFDKAMININEMKLIDVIKKKAIIDKIPILGICLGMQLMGNQSEEGKEIGLGLINSNVIRFNFFENQELKIPHMGWNNLIKHKDHPLFSENYENSRYYFVHSFYVVCNDKNDVLTTTNYGFNFCSSFAHENIMGVQFHPEKSHRFGTSLLKNFIEKF